MKAQHGPMVLLILDGWGIAPAGSGNAITLARLSVMPELWKRYPHAKLKASGSAVGLPARQHGNSEAGHMNLGAGRIVEQDAVRINHTIDDGRFFKNSAFLHAIAHAGKHGGTLHLMGLLTNDESGHAYPRHLEALLKLAREKFDGPTHLHLFTDGRDTPKYEAIILLKRLNKQLGKKQMIATIAGRYAMDRAKRWSRTEAAYNALTIGRGVVAKNAEEAILAGYQRGETDEFIKPTVIGATTTERRAGRITNNDAVIFFQLRSDRARQLAKPFVQPKFEEMNPGSFRRKKILHDLSFVALTEFGPDLPGIITAFPSVTIKDTFPMQFRDVRQLYIAESEKYAHITYFFNGGYANPVAGEERVVLASSNDPSFDATPAMQTPAITEKIVASLTKHTHDIIVANFASADMVGHTGNLKAAIKAVTIIDGCIKKLADTVLAQNGTLCITGDHGNVEAMIEPSGAVDPEHTSNLVPFILVHGMKKKFLLHPAGVLGDVAPTVLTLLHRQKPKAMTGHSLLLP